MTSSPKLLLPNITNKAKRKEDNQPPENLENIYRLLNTVAVQELV